MESAFSIGRSIGVWLLQKGSCLVGLGHWSLDGVMELYRSSIHVRKIIYILLFHYVTRFDLQRQTHVAQRKLSSSWETGFVSLSVHIPFEHVFAQSCLPRVSPRMTFVNSSDPLAIFHCLMTLRHHLVPLLSLRNDQQLYVRTKRPSTRSSHY